MDISNLPPRLTTDEVCAVGRISERTFSRRRLSGRYQIEPIDRARQNLWNKGDVLRIFGMVAPLDMTPSTEPQRLRVDPDAIRAARAAQRRKDPGNEKGRFKAR